MTNITPWRLTALAILLMSATVLPAQASHTHNPVLCQAADAYRLSVRDFDRHVRKFHYIDQCDIRLVGQLEDGACALRTAANHPEPLCNFLDLWHEVQELHFRVESAIFRRACYPRNPHLELCWKKVTHFYVILAEQIRCLETHQHVGQRIPVVQRSVSLRTSPRDLYREFGSESPQFYDHKSYLQSLAARQRLQIQSSTRLRDRVPEIPTYQHRSRSLLPAPNTAVPSPRTLLPKSNLSIPSRRNLIPTSHSVDFRNIGSDVIGSLLARLIR